MQLGLRGEMSSLQSYRSLNRATDETWVWLSPVITSSYSYFIELQSNMSMSNPVVSTTNGTSNNRGWPKGSASQIVFVAKRGLTIHFVFHLPPYLPLKFLYINGKFSDWRWTTIGFVAIELTTFDISRHFVKRLMQAKAERENLQKVLCRVSRFLTILTGPKERT